MLTFLMPAFAAPPTTAKFTTSTASEAGYFLQVNNGSWSDIKNPKHYGTDSATTAMCLDHTKESPTGTQNYVRYSASSIYSTSTINGLYAILEHGYPYESYGMSGNEIKAATANAIRIWLRESEGIGYSYMTTVNVRAKPGYDHVYNTMVSLVVHARNADGNELSWSGESITTSPATVTLEPNAGGTALTGAFTVNNPADSFSVDSSKLPSGVSITGSGDTRTITAPLGTRDFNVSNIFGGKSNKTKSNIYFYKPSFGTAYQPLVVWDYVTEATVIAGDLSIKGQSGGFIQVIKRDDETSRYLQGAIFGIYTPDDVLVDTLVTNVNGTEKSVFLDSGEYYVQEITSPTGYVADDAKHYVSVAINGQTHVLWLKNTKIKGRVELLKVGETDNPLSSAVYGLYKSDNTFIEDLTTNGNGISTSSLSPYGHYYLKEKVAPANYSIDPLKHEFTIAVNNETISVKATNTLKSGNIQIAKVDDQDNPIEGIVFAIYDNSDALLEELTTNENGLAVSDEYIFGDYYLKEISALPQYLLLSEDIPFTIDQNDVTISIDVVNNLKRGYIEIVKTGDYEINGANENIPLPGTEFEVRLKSSNTLIETIITDEMGIATSSNLPYGIYTVSESVTPFGYISSEPFDINIDTDGTTQTFDIENKAARANITIIKKDIDTGLPVLIAGTEFKIMDRDGNYIIQNGIDTFTTDDAGSVTLELPLYLGQYTLHEVTPPYGYYIDETPIPFAVDETSAEEIVLEHSNKKILKQIRVTKSDARDNDRKLEGTVFEIIDSDETAVETITTNSNGEALSSLLPYGAYTVKEKTPPVGFTISNEVHSVFIGDEKNEVYDVFTQNEPTEITITKKGKDTNYTLEGSRIQVFNDNDLLVYEGITDGDGMLNITEIPIGSYTFKEVKAPLGYTLSQDTYVFEITKDGAESTEIYFENDPTDVTITKIDSVSNMAISDAEIEVFNADGESIYAGKTNQDGRITLTHLPIGTYTAVETKAPDGYILTNDTVEFSIDEYGVVAGQTEIENCPTELNLFKVDYETNGRLTGAGFKIKNFLGLNVLNFDQDENGVYWFNKDGEVAEILVDDNGEAIIHGLPFGNYWIEESITPEGYYPTAPIKISITEDNDIDAPYEAIIANSLYVKLGLDRERWIYPSVLGFMLMIVGGYVYVTVRRKKKEKL
jgi:uncharacterized surface anchored protein